MARNGDNKSSGNSSATLGYEAQLWAAADKMRGHMDASEYKHVCLGLIFLKYISDAFEEKREQLLFGFSDPKSEWFIKDEPQRAEAAENRDEYLAANVFWLPAEARWHIIKAKAKSPEIGKVIDDAMGAIERENPTLKGVLPRDYARPSLDKVRLGGLVDIISNIGFNESAAKSKDVLGRVYEYFLGKFASAEGKGGGEFYTPQCVVQVLVAMLEPYKGRVFDPCCGSGGMFVQSDKFVEEHGGRVGDIAVYGQESNYTTWKLARMNLAIRGIDANLGQRNADSFRADLHPDLKADFILANPPFNMSDWGGENLRQDVRWKFGMPPVNNANYAWIQHFIHHLSPVGVAGFVMANGSMSTQTSNEGEIRKTLIEYEQVCVILHGFDYGAAAEAAAAKRLPLIAQAAEHVLQQKDGKPRFLLTVTELSKAFALAVPNDEALEIRDEVGFFQEVRAVLAKSISEGGGKSPEELDLAVRQIVSRAISSDKVIDIFDAAGLKKPDISILSDEFLSEVQHLPQRNLAVELLQKLLNNELRIRQKKYLVQSRSFAEMLEATIRKYQNRTIEAAQVIAELIDLAKQMREGQKRGEKLGLTDDEIAFYDALEVNDSAVKQLGDPVLKKIAQELVAHVRRSVTIDWTLRESARAQIRVLVRRILRKYGYPPDKQEKATQTVLEQAELICAEVAA